MAATGGAYCTAGTGAVITVSWLPGYNVVNVLCKKGHTPTTGTDYITMTSLCCLITALSHSNCICVTSLLNTGYEQDPAVILQYLEEH